MVCFRAIESRRDATSLKRIVPAEMTSLPSPLSWFQERMWVHHQRSPESTSYSLPLLLEVKGDLDVPALERSLSLVVVRHESLRTAYGERDEGVAEQRVAPAEPVHLPVLAVDRDGLLEHLDQVLEHRFDLHKGPVFVARLLRLAPDRHLLLFNVHHIAADAWSLKAIFLAELQGAYAAFARAEQPDLPPLTLQYTDFARLQRTSDVTVDLDYWRETLDGYEDTLELPTVHPRQRRSGTTSGTFVHRYPDTFARELERFSRRHGSTIFMSLLAALGVTLSRYTDRDDLCIGTTASDRPDVAFEPLIGFFVNIVPLRLHVDEQAGVTELMEAVRSRVLGAFEHPVPFERVLQVTDAARRGSANPLVPVVMRHQNFPEAALGAALPGDVTFRSYPGRDEADDAVLSLVAREHVPARCEIELSYAGGGDGLEVEVVYASDLYDRAAVERLLAHHQRVLEGMIADADRRVVDLPLLRDSDVAELVGRGDRVPVIDTPAQSFVERFDAQVARTPDAVACRDDEGAWSYLDLSRRADRVAEALVARGTGPGELVAVCLPRGGDLVATLLGVWRAGAAYVPLDPSYPAAYLQQILDDASPRAVVCDARHQALLGIEESRCVRLDDVGSVTDAGGDGSDGRATSSGRSAEPDTHATHEARTHEPDASATSSGWIGGADALAPSAPRTAAPAAAPAHPAGPDALAYVMYTSGSTGRPKGVRVPHRQLDNWLAALEARLPFEPGEVVAQKTPFAFAVAVKELFAGLLHGCPQVILADATVRDVAAFVDALAEHRVTRLNLVPSHLAAVLEHLESTGTRLPALRTCITAGEPLPRAQVLAFRELLPGARLLNNYGCTELNDVTYYDTAGFDGQRELVPIGTPIANTKVYVLDRRGRLVPDGVPGELHVSSVGMPEGYHRLDDLTAERFVPDPFGGEAGGRLYNTGDVVRYLPDGTLDFLGRWDFQVKVRGARIDVRQVEEVMSGFDGLRARAVVGRGERLVAFYTARPGRDVAVGELRAFLQQRLPAYLVPDAFVLLDAMPQLPNGKLDRRALVESEGELQESEAYEAPATATERTLAGIWGVVVNLPAARIGRRSHFFDIGGHSLAAMRVLARTKDAFGVELHLSELFDAPRLADLAAAVDRKAAALASTRPGARSSSAAARASARAAGSGLLHGKVVLVTGGSRGIGLSTALLLAEQGATVAINYRDSEAQARHVQGLIEAEGGTADVFAADVTRADDVDAMVAAVHDRFERIDVLVANAHMHFRHAPVLGYDWADLERKVGDELKAVFHVSQAVAPEMVARGNGSIIAVSSTLSKRSNTGFLAQSTAKAAVDAFVRTLATELGPHGVRANTVAPGLTLTDAAMPMAPHVKEQVAAQCPMRRNGLPEDMAGAVVFLASDLSRFMTGTYLPVDGGFTTL